MRIDSALIPPGFIAHAKMYSLILENQKLYILYTGSGPSSQKDYTRGLLQMRQRKDGLSNIAVSALIQKYIRTIQENEKRITESNLEALGKEDNSYIVELKDIKGLSIKWTEVDVTLRIETLNPKKKFKFDCSLIYKDAITSFYDYLNQHCCQG